MAQNLQMANIQTIFSEEELGRFENVRNALPGFVELGCGCTSKRYGDTSGNLRIFEDGKLLVECQCPGCQCNPSGSVILPAEFAKHGGKQSPVGGWRNQIWVTDSNNKRLKLSKTCLLKYYTEQFQRVQRGPIIHRDEFITCKRCGKKRRFSLRTKQECRSYHDALAKVDWTCFDMEKPCDDEEERKSRMPMRRCPRRAKCIGCVRCVCVGCTICRFEDCNCQTCVDFCQNQLPN